MDRQFPDDFAPITPQIDDQLLISDTSDGGNAKIVEIGDLPISTDTQTALSLKQSISEKGQINGYASLDGSGKVPSSQLPPSSSSVNSVNGQTGVVVLTQDDIGDGTTYKQYSETEKTKLAGIEAGAEVNNISDANATDLTDGGDTTLHIHDSRYYTETEVNSLISNVGVNFFTLSETVVLNGNTYQQSCISQTDARYGTGTELTGPTVTGTNIAGGKAVSDAGVISSIPAGPIATHLKVRKISGNADFTFYYEYYKLASDGTETLLGTSSISDQVHSNTTTEFTVTTILPATTFGATDRLMRKGFFTKVGSGTDPVVGITVEGTDPTYVSLAIPVTSVSFAHNDTTGKQGGTTGEYYHLTQTEHTNATQNASSTLTGLLSSTDWNTFNNKQPAGSYLVTTNNLSDISNQQTALNNITAVSGATNEYVLTKDTATGNAIWKAGGGGGLSWGSSITGTSGTGLTTTIGNSASAGTIGQSIIADNTQSNVVTLLNLDTGTSLRSNKAISIKGLYGNNTGIVEINNFGSLTQALGPGHSILMGAAYNTSTSYNWSHIYINNRNNSGGGLNTGIDILQTSGGFNTNFTNSGFGKGSAIKIQTSGTGSITAIAVGGGDNVNSSTNGLVNYTLSSTQSGATVMQKIDTSTSAQGHTAYLAQVYNASTSASAFSAQLSTTGTGIGFKANSSALSGAGVLMNLNHTASGALSNCTTNQFTIQSSRTLTSALNIDDNYNVGYIKKTSTNSSGNFTSAGSVLKLENSSSLSGINSDNSFVLDLQQGAVTSTNFRKMIQLNGITVWLSNGTSPNGTISGTTGDICLNGPRGQMFYCTTGVNWTGM